MSGRASARRSRLAGGLYWFTVDALAGHLRRNGHRFRRIRVRDLEIEVDVTDATGLYPYFYGDPYERAVTDALVTALRPGDAFIDIGANIGYFSTLGALVVGTAGRVVSFEPHPDARAALQAMAERNGVAAVIEIVPVALAEREGDLTLYTSGDATVYSTLDPANSPMREVVAFLPGTLTRVLTLDGWYTGGRNWRPGFAPSRSTSREPRRACWRAWPKRWRANC